MSIFAKHDDPGFQKQAELAHRMERLCRQDGVHATAIPFLSLIRSSDTTQSLHQVLEPSLCIVAQGAKVVMLEEESYTYNPSSYLVVSVDLPISSQITEASADSPYLCLRLQIDPQQLFNIVQNADLEHARKSSPQRGIFVSETQPELLEAAVRLVSLLDTPEDIPVLGPLFYQEILYRLLKDNQGDYLRQLAMNGSSSHRITEAIHRIKLEYDKPLRIEELASSVHMSQSSLHRHFKEITNMSPLQYQKKIRLLEARRLLLSEGVDAADAGFKVGYESPSQFSREYGRMFGRPPISDVKRLKSNN